MLYTFYKSEYKYQYCFIPNSKISSLKEKIKRIITENPKITVLPQILLLLIVILYLS